MLYNTYLINLDGSEERLEASRTQLEAANIPFTRISAVDGRVSDPRDHPSYDTKRTIAFMGRHLNGGELGCYLSHLKAAEQFLKSDAQYAMILEDDLSIQNDLAKMVDDVLIWAETQKLSWDLMNIGSTWIKRHTPLKAFTSGTEVHVLSKAHYFPMTTGGLIWSRAGAQAFVDSKDIIYAPIDSYLRDWLTKTNSGLAVSPALIRTTGAGSDIDAVASASRKTADRDFFYNLIRQRWSWLNKFRSLRHMWAEKLK